MKSAAALLLPALVVLSACSSTSGEGYSKPGLDVMSIERVAVVDGNNAGFAPATRQALLDTFALELFKRGWNVIDRSNVDQAVAELEFQNSSFASPDDRREIGRTLNVDALLVVNIATADSEISMTAKMFDPETSETLWIGTGEGSLRKLLGAVTGAVVGGVIGEAVGDGTGATVGGVLGGATGVALGPSQLENAKRVVGRVCESLPARL